MLRTMTVASIAFPATDRAVIAEAVVVMTLTAAGLWWTRRSSEARLFVLGLFVMTVALFGLRALH